MRRFSNRLLPAWGIVLLASGVPAVAAGLEGLWLTADEDAHVKVERCDDQAVDSGTGHGEALCGTLVWLANPDDEDGRPRRDVHHPDVDMQERPILGLEILRIGSVPDRKGVYRDGTIYDPKNGKTYRCKATLDGNDTVRLRGFVGISLLGRTTRWSRR